MKKNTLQKFKVMLEERLETLQNHIHIANASISELHHQSYSDHADAISANTQGILDLSLIDQYNQELKDITRSLHKIQEGIFGICEMCGDDIDENRLWVKPHARYCILCREIYEKKSTGVCID